MAEWVPKHEIKVMETKTPAGKGKTKAKTVEAVAGNTVPVKSDVYVFIDKEKTPRVAFDIGFDTRGKDMVLLEMQAGCEFMGGTGLFNTANLERVNLNLIVTEANQKSNGAKPTSEEVDALKKAKEELKALVELGLELNQKAAIPFCVYSILGDGDPAHRVVIFQSGQPPNPKPGGAKAGGVKKSAPKKSLEPK